MDAGRDEQQREDSRLIAEIRNKDERALVAVYRRYGNRLFSLIVRIVTDRAVAEEILQDVFLRLWDRADQYDPAKGLLLSWLFTVARNLALDHLRSESRRAKTSVFPDVAPELQSSVALRDCLRDKDFLLAVKQALDSLPHEQRAVIELVYFEGLTHRELAQRLDEPLGTVKTRVRLGLRKIRELLFQLAVLL